MTETRKAPATHPLSQPELEWLLKLVNLLEEGSRMEIEVGQGKQEHIDVPVVIHDTVVAQLRYEAGGVYLEVVDHDA